MGLFFNRKKDKEKAKVNNNVNNNDNRKMQEAYFWKLYEESLVLKDNCALISAYKKRESALDTCPNAQFKKLAYHNLASLEIFHMGSGISGGLNARAGHDDSTDFKFFESYVFSKLRFELIPESFQLCAMTSTSYDECESFLQYLSVFYEDRYKTMYQQFLDFKKDHPRYGDYQKATAQMYYSRVSPELDKGDYAPALALLEIILENAEKPEYDLSYEEYVDVLDDYGVLSCMLIEKKGAQLAKYSVDMASEIDHLIRFGGAPTVYQQELIRKTMMENYQKELSFIADRAIERIESFMPDCESADREKFNNILSALKNLQKLG